MFLFRYILMSSPIIGMFSPFMVESGLSPLSIAITFVTFFLGMQIFEIPSSIIADRFSRKKVIMFASVVILFATVIFLFSHSKVAFIMHMFLVGIGIALFSGTVEALLYDELKAIGKEDKYQKVFAVLRIAISAGIGTSLVLSSFLVKYGYDIIVWISLTFTAISLVIFTFFMKETPRTKDVESAHSFREIFHEGARTIFNNKRLSFTVLLAIFFATGSMVNSDIAMINAINLGWLKENIARVFAVNTIAECILTFIFAKYCANISVKHLHIAMMAVFLCAIVGLACGKMWSIFFLFPMWWLNILQEIVVSGQVQIEAKSSSRATTQSCISMFFGMHYCLVMLALGFIANLYSYKIAIMVILSFCLLELLTLRKLG